MTRVVVLGDVVTDVAAQLLDDPAPGSDAAASITVGGGGAGGNVAAWLAHTGEDVHLVARIGSDELGRARRQELESAGVRCHLAVDPFRATGTNVVVVDWAGERTMYPDRDANLALAEADVPESVFSPGAHLHVSGYALLHEGRGRPRCTRSVSPGASTWRCRWTPASTAPLATAGVGRFLDWIAGADLLLPNGEEACLLTGLADPVEAGPCRMIPWPPSSAGAAWPRRRSRWPGRDRAWGQAGRADRAVVRLSPGVSRWRPDCRARARATT